MCKMDKLFNHFKIFLSSQFHLRIHTKDLSNKRITIRSPCDVGTDEIRISTSESPILMVLRPS